MSTVKKNISKQGYSADLNKYMGKKLKLRLNGGRDIEGIVVGLDGFMNLVLDKAFEISGKERRVLYKTVVRGNSILMWELLEKVEWLISECTLY